MIFMPPLITPSYPHPGFNPFLRRAEMGRAGTEVAEVSIDENDFSRGFIQFNVTRNKEGVVDAFELPMVNNTLKVCCFLLLLFSQLWPASGLLSFRFFWLCFCCCSRLRCDCDDLFFKTASIGFYCGMVGSGQEKKANVRLDT